MTTATTDLGATVADIYAAFGRGDVPAILAALSPTVEWDADPGNYGQRAGVTALQARRGPDDVAQFFGYLAGCTFHEFTVRELMTGESSVAAHVHIDFSLPGGGRLRGPEIHLWTFDGDGKVAAFAHFVDTAKLIAADRGADTTA
ncbi:MAG TPA: nuclear transport factor 2 family protein [Aldersonia sp.]